MAKRLLVIGSANLDHIVKTPYIPAPGETIFSDARYAFSPGGKGANSAVAAAKLGLVDLYFCARVGDDAYGDRLREIYKQFNVDSKFVVTDKTEQTGYAVVLLENDGTNRIIVFPGANKNLCEHDVDVSFDAYPDAVLTQFEAGVDAVLATARHARKDGIPLFIDAGPAIRGFPLEKLGRVECFSPNEVETEVLTGIRPNSMENCLRASINLCNRADIRYVVLKLGVRGCFVYDGKYCDLVSSYEVDAVDTTAAGDAFTAALTSEYMNSGDIISAAKFANAVGALTVTKTGAIPSLPTLPEVRKLMEEQNI